MPSTLVHLALAGFLAAALLGSAFGWRSVAVVFGVVVLVDLDVFLGWFVLGAHRAAFHTLLWPALAAALLVYDTRVRDESWLVDRVGQTAPRIAWVTIAAVVFAAIGPDLMSNGANVLYPVHDQFYAFDGTIRLSDQRGIVQSFVDLSAEQPTESVAKGSSEEVQYRTGVDPDPTNTGTVSDPDTERIFLVVDSGLQLLLVVTSAVTLTGRFFDEREE